MKKNNIIFFTGENRIFLKKELERWIQTFEEKHGNFNVSKISPDNLEKINLENELMTLPFLGQSRLVILENILSSTNSKDKENENYENNHENKLLSIIEQIPESTFIIFVQENPDKRKLLYKKIIEIGTIKEFNNLDECGLKSYIREHLLYIDNEAISKLIEYKSGKIELIEGEIEKLILFRSKDRITIKDIESFVDRDIDSNIFSFTDSIFELNLEKSLINLKNLLINSKIEPIFASIMTNIRKYLFVIFLHKIGTEEQKIIETLKIHPFIYKKSLHKSKNYSIILNFYKQLIKIDTKAKRGELIQDNETGLKMALEKVILDLKKNKIYLQ